MTSPVPASDLPFLPYCRQFIDAADIRHVVRVLRSSHLTTGPAVEAFEKKFARQVGSRVAVSASSGTAALQMALSALRLRPGDEVITTPYSFVATSNSIIHAGGVPVFVDIFPGGFNIDVEKISQAITPRTKAVLAVHFAGEPCRLNRLLRICRRHGLALIEDAAHALGAAYRGRPIGAIGHLTTFSFHPAKHITCGEGGMVTTDSAGLAARARSFRNHGMTADANRRITQRKWKYDIVHAGCNYRLSDIHSALGISQLDKLRPFGRRRLAIVDRYRETLKEVEEIVLPEAPAEAGTRHAWHLFVIRLRLDRLTGGRDAIFDEMRRRGVGVNVHYTPIHLFTYYRKRFGYRKGDFPNAERTFREVLTLPLFPAMTDTDVRRVVRTLKDAIATRMVRRYS